MTSTRTGPASSTELKSLLRGQLIQPEDQDFDAARAVWNGMIDRRPAAIVRCAGVADVIAAVRYAQAHELPIAVRGGGHNVAGFGTCDGGLMIDLGPMKGIRVDPHARTASAQPGLTWGEFDHETQAFGLATTGGLVSTTGIAGLTLGGGIGWLVRRYGLTADNVLGVDLVTATGDLVHASPAEHPELFWAVRGGGGNFGIVTNFDYRLHPVGPMVLGGALFHTADRATELLRFYRGWAERVPDELTTVVAFLTAPPEPFVPAPLIGQPLVAVALCYQGDIEQSLGVIAELRGFAPAAIDLLGPLPYTSLQRMFDASSPRGIRSYWKTSFLDELTDSTIASRVDSARRMAALSPFTTLHLYQLGGAVARAPGGQTPFSRRDAHSIVNVIGQWTEAGQDAAHIAWARACWRALQPLSTSGAYVNFMSGEEPDTVRAAYGDQTYARLAEVKARYDPSNVFRLNQNITPAVR